MADREYLKQLTRKALIRDPSISIRRLAKLLGVANNTAMSIRNEVAEDRKKEIEDQIEELREKSVEEALVETREEFDEVVRELWKIITDKGSNKSEKVRAIGQLVRTRETLITMMFDAGLFKRDLGKASIDLIGLFEQALEDEEKGPKKPSKEN